MVRLFWSFQRPFRKTFKVKRHEVVALVEGFKKDYNGTFLFIILRKFGELDEAFAASCRVGFFRV